MYANITLRLQLVQFQLPSSLNSHFRVWLSFTVLPVGGMEVGCWTWHFYATCLPGKKAVLVQTDLL